MCIAKSFIFLLLGISFSMACAGPGGRQVQETNDQFLINQPGGQGRENRILPEPERTGGMPLLEALDKRQSMRTFSPEALSEQDLSNLLWAAWGINREDGRRTAPTARNRQQFDIYLIMAEGWYLYDPHQHALIRLGDEDLRVYAGNQAFVQTAPLNLVFVSDHERMSGYNAAHRDFYSATDVGFISQNVYLYCASEGLATVVRGALNREKLHEKLKLRVPQHVILGQSVGYPGREN